MTQDQIKTSILQQQDQDIEAAKDWIKQDAPEGQWSKDVLILWDFVTRDYSDDKLLDITTRFAIIGIRHVLERMS
jgi:hypothetical protein